MIWDADDFGANHVISDQCQSHDCRDQLDKFHYANPNFKATLFAIPGEMTAELCNWCKANEGWIQLAVHGIYHSDNWECSKMTYDEIERHMDFFEPMLEEYFVKGFKAPGWQISDDWYKWLMDNDYWVADQSYNSHRLPVGLPAYVNNNGQFMVNGLPVDGKHFHTWDCVGNGVYELNDQILNDIQGVDEFRFVSEVLHD